MLKDARKLLTLEQSVLKLKRKDRNNNYPKYIYRDCRVGRRLE